MSKILSFVEVPTTEVISACKNTLDSIYQERSIHRREFVTKWLQIYTWRWMLFLRWFGFRKPTRRDALFDYYHNGFFSPNCNTVCPTIIQVDSCKKLLQSALATNQSLMLISNEGISICNF